MNKTIFREYDIRGIVGDDLNVETVELLGKGIGTFMRRRVESQNPNIIVGRDNRLSSDDFRDALIKGLHSTGCNVTDIGIVPTPVFYFSFHHIERDGGIQITGSHNPPEFNGFKVYFGGSTIFGDLIQEVFRIIEKGEFATGSGSEEKIDVIPDYIDMVLSKINLKRKLKVVIDAGNGTGGPIALEIMKRLDCEVHDLYCTMDGSFPNHHPDPTLVENMQDLIAKVEQTGSDVGIAYDGDADRIGAVDEKGSIIWGDKLLILYSRDVLKRKGKGTFIGEVKCSETLYNDIGKRGGNIVMWKTGHSLIKQKMKEVHADLAGEMSGHMFFADGYFGYDDAIFASARLLQLLADSEQKLSEMLSDLPQTVVTPEIRVECPDNLKFDVVQKTLDHFRSKYEVIDVDGVRIKFGGIAWGLCRASNTQPALVLRFEAENEQRLNEIRSEVENYLLQFDAVKL